MCETLHPSYNYIAKQLADWKEKLTVEQEARCARWSSSRNLSLSLGNVTIMWKRHICTMLVIAPISPSCSLPFTCFPGFVLYYFGIYCFVFIIRLCRYCLYCLYMSDYGFKFYVYY